MSFRKIVASPVICLYILFTFSIGNQVSGTPIGAPAAACSTMTPDHGVPAQTSASPYVTIPTLMADESVRLTLLVNSTGISTFKGFLVMAFDNSLGDTAAPIGTFSEIVEGTPAITPANYLNCLSGSKNAATHTNNSEKVIVNLLWVPPSGFVGNVVFKTTFVRNVTTFWVKTLSDVISVSSPTTTTPSTTPPTTTTPIIQAGAPQLAPWIGTIFLALVTFMLASPA
ncbi:hypothetical protein DAPPUDRAFT_307896 [Daphnia pulex]|uniref:Reelin domain-containing protein n=1 Tax=Daphnia pulex TaxID=6669 RepID=E9G180_DAPPU|nr:hypothetical protein DAPPUDRAFT_307896 [Daphnia pulex]|eukprot:EFX86687.1 hypothetical protein DAPPUDRAFT_307896 [Daphnia pulex]